MSAQILNDDFKDVLRALKASGAEFVIVGAHALAAHGLPRATGDLDILVRPTDANARRVAAALRAFGAPLQSHGISEADFAVEGKVYQLGLPPRRIDILTSISAVSFEACWATRMEHTVEGEALPFLGYEALLQNKRSTGRDKDALDVKALERHRGR